MSRISTVHFDDLTHATIRCRRCGIHRDVPLDRLRPLAENYQAFAAIRREFDDKHGHCPEKTDA